eukprot:1156244-Pelagomonas_calceolata.AAC.12
MHQVSNIQCALQHCKASKATCTRQAINVRSHQVNDGAPNLEVPRLLLALRQYCSNSFKCALASG